MGCSNPVEHCLPARIFFAEFFINRRHGLDKDRFIHLTDHHPLFLERRELLGFVIPD